MYHKNKSWQKRKKGYIFETQVFMPYSVNQRDLFELSTITLWQFKWVLFIGMWGGGNFYVQQKTSWIVIENCNLKYLE